VAAAIARRRSELPFGDLFGERTVLVPVPRSGLMKPGSLWPASNIAQALVEHALGWRVAPVLRRRQAVRKSAFAEPGDRPRPEEHRLSLSVERALGMAGDILLVDDIVTRGSTFLGAASRLAQDFPGVKIRAFAVLRTMGLQPEIEQILAPCRGRPFLVGDRADREP